MNKLKVFADGLWLHLKIIKEYFNWQNSHSIINWTKSRIFRFFSNIAITFAVLNIFKNSVAVSFSKLFDEIFWSFLLRNGVGVHSSLNSQSIWRSETFFLRRPFFLSILKSIKSSNNGLLFHYFKRSTFLKKKKKKKTKLLRKMVSFDVHLTTALTFFFRML